MPRLKDEDGVILWRPEKNEIVGLKVGDVALDVFGGFSKVVEITCMRQDVKGKWFVHYYTDFGPGSRISHSAKEGEIVATIPLIEKYHRSENANAAYENLL